MESEHPFLAGLHVNIIRDDVGGGTGVAATTPAQRECSPLGVADALAIGHAAWLARQAKP